MPYYEGKLYFCLCIAFVFVSINPSTLKRHGALLGVAKICPIRQHANCLWPVEVPMLMGKKGGKECFSSLFLDISFSSTWSLLYIRKAEIRQHIHY